MFGSPLDQDCPGFQAGDGPACPRPSSEGGAGRLEKGRAAGAAGGAESALGSGAARRAGA